MNTLDKWTRPDCYTGENHFNSYIFLSRTRDGDLLEESNFHVGLARLGGESETVRVIRERHWACGWIEWIKIDASDIEAISKAQEMIDDLSDYPCLCEDDLSEREYLLEESEV
jgi:hypothetical protein